MAADSTPAAFPADYLGKWGGTLEIFTAKGRAQTVPMQLHILPFNDTTYTYAIFYGEDLVTGKRDYLLRPVSGRPHHWIVDEQDGILLDNYYLGGILHGPFSVQGTLLFSTLEKRGDALIYAISSGSNQPARNSSGSETDENGSTTVYEVKTFEVRNYQRAVLRKL